MLREKADVKGGPAEKEREGLANGEQVDAIETLSRNHRDLLHLREEGHLERRQAWRLREGHVGLACNWPSGVGLLVDAIRPLS